MALVRIATAAPAASQEDRVVVGREGDPADRTGAGHAAAWRRRPAGAVVAARAKRASTTIAAAIARVTGTSCLR